LRWLNWDHFLAADDTDIFPGDFVCRCIWVPLVHIPRRISVTHEVHNAAGKRADGHNNIPQNVDGEAIECEQNSKKAQINHKFQQIGQKIQVEDPTALLLPPGHVNLHLINIVFVGQIGRRGGSSCAGMLSNRLDTRDADLVPTFLHLGLDLLAGYGDLGQRNNVSQEGGGRENRQDGEFESKHDHHIRPCLRNYGPHTVP
jgi:hypothetical protein